MTEEEIIAFVRGLPRVYAMTADEAGGEPEVAWGDSFFYYGEERQMPFTTVVVKDYPGWDEASNLDREGVFRLNASVGREAFQELLGYPPGQIPEGLDYAAFDVLLPHPAYAAQGWVSVVCPSDQARALLERAHARAAARG
jgi:hypothetical protein